ncbi:MAG: gliding motility-associated C-terminal domain-containing protein [Bacteroidota bacterium]
MILLLRSTLLNIRTLILLCIPVLFFAKAPENHFNYKELPEKKQSNKITELSIEKKNEIHKNISDQPVKFIENNGQILNTDNKAVPFVLFKAEAPGMDVYITEKGVSYVFVTIEEDEEEKEKEHKRELHEEKVKTRLSWINLFLKNATIKKENIIKEKRGSEHFNFFDSNNPKGIYNVYEYEKITIKNVYPNIDWVFYNSDKSGMKYDFIVHPGANPALIKLIYDSEKPLNIDSKGNIQLTTKLGTLTENAPYSYIQETQKEVKTGFIKKQINKHQTEVIFDIDTLAIASDQTLIIDPQLEWGTFIGGNGLDGPLDISTDHIGNVYVTGYTVSANFPLLVLAGAYNQTYASTGSSTTFIIKYDNLGVRLWSTIYRAFQARSIAIDNFNNVYIVGDPYTGISLQNLPGAYNQTAPLGQDAAILKFDVAGARLWATYFGGSDFDLVSAIATDNLDNIYITGMTMPLSGTAVNDLPIQNLPGAYNQPLSGGSSDAFILKFNSANALQWSTYYGGNGYERPYGITTDNVNTVYLTGETGSTDLPLQNLTGSYNQSSLMGTSSSDAFIAKFSNTSALQWSTYYGGNDRSLGFTLITDNVNNLYVYGGTMATNLSLQNLPGAYNQTTFIGGQACFIMKFDNAGVRQWATYYAGNGVSAITNGNNQNNLAIDNCNNLYVGITTFTSVPAGLITSSLGYDLNTYRGGVNDVFITKFSSSGAIIWDSYIGGNDYDIRSVLTTDHLGNLFMAGEWCSNGTPNSSTYPLANINTGSYYDPTFNGGNDDGCILKFSPLPLTTTQTQTNNLSCTCNGVANVSITSGEAPYTYQWSDGTVVANTTNTLSSISGLCSGVYQVTVTSSCYSTKVETYTITGSTGTPSINVVTTNSVLCGAQTATLSVIGTGTVNWSNGSTSATTTVNTAGVYTATLTNSCGTAINSVTINAMSTPTLSGLPATQNICAGQSATLTAISNAGNYLWDTGASTNSIVVTTPGIRTVTVSNACGSVTASVSVILNTLPTINLTASTLTLCPNETATLTAIGGFTPYVWSNSTSTGSMVTSTGGTVSVSNTNACGTTTQTINIIPVNLNASISANPLSGEEPLAVNFTNNSTGATTYLWNFGNNTTANTQTASAVTYTNAGTYNVYLTVTSGACIDIDSLTIIVLPEELGFIIPNVFTPNGDSINDVWHFSLGKGTSLQAFSIYNRWGNLVKFNEIKSQNYINWDGRTTSGEPVSAGVYFYILQYTDAKGEENKKSGFITLIR